MPPPPRLLNKTCAGSTPHCYRVKWKRSIWPLLPGKSRGGLMLKCNSILFGTMIAVFMGNGLTGCVTMTPEQQAQLQRDAAIQITCTKGDDCEEKWSRAVAWISQNSSYKIQTQTDSLIQTFNPTGSSPSSGSINSPWGKGSTRLQCRQRVTTLLDAFQMLRSCERALTDSWRERQR